jgi:addiction module RelE/StbE family toxin
MTLQVKLTRAFLKSSKKLPVKQLEKLGSLLEILCDNPFSPLLHTKALTGTLTGFYSFRITRDWRVIFQFLDEVTLKIIDVAHRRDVYR